MLLPWTAIECIFHDCGPTGMSTLTSPSTLQRYAPWYCCTIAQQQMSTHSLCPCYIRCHHAKTNVWFYFLVKRPILSLYFAFLRWLVMFTWFLIYLCICISSFGFFLLIYFVSLFFMPYTYLCYIMNTFFSKPYNLPLCFLHSHSLLYFLRQSILILCSSFIHDFMYQKQKKT